MAASPTTAVTKSAASGLLIFDGDCGFCTTTARKFGDFGGESVAVEAWQFLDLDEHGLTEADVAKAAYWVQDGTVYKGADGFAKALQVCPTPGPLLGKIMATPPIIWLARGIYPIIAKYRHKMPGGTAACAIRPPAN